MKNIYLIAILLTLSSCSRIYELPDLERRSLATKRGSPIYTGHVFNRGGDELLFVYDRSVVQSDPLESLHTTFTPDRSEILVRQTATHSKQYELIEFTETQNQTGIISTVKVVGDSLFFKRRFDGETTTSQKKISHPPVVGPTLFGFVRVNWETIVAQPMLVDFVAADRETTFQFELALIGRTATSTRFSFSPTGFFTGMFVDDMELEFDLDRNPVAYHGLIPPKNSTMDSVEGSVKYKMVSEYR